MKFHSFKQFLFLLGVSLLTAGMLYAENSSRKYLEEGIAKFKANDIKGAIDAYTAGIKIKPDHILYNNRGLAKQTLKDHHGAIADLNLSIQMNSKYYLAYYNRGISKEALKDFSGALADFNQAISINPKYFKAYNNRGIAKAMQKDYNGAYLDFQKAIELEPSSGNGYLNRGLIKKQRGDKKGACEDFKLALSKGYAPANVQIKRHCQ